MRYRGCLEDDSEPDIMPITHIAPHWDSPSHTVQLEDQDVEIQNAAHIDQVDA